MEWALDYPFGPTLTWLLVVVAVMVLLGSFGLVWRQLWPITAASVGMIAVRLAALGLLVTLLLQPKVLREHSEEIKPHVAVLIDTSGSMRKVHRATDAPRLRQAIAELSGSKLLETLGERSELSVYEFTTSLSKITAGRVPTLADEAEADPKEKRRPAMGTGLGVALSQVRDELANLDVAGIIVLSDGRYNTGIDPEKAVEGLESPLYTVCYGARVKKADEKAGDRPTRDVGIVNVAHDKRVVVGHTTDVAITLEGKGVSGPVDVELLLNKAVIATSVANLSPERPKDEVRIKLTPATPGQALYTVRIDSQDDNEANNEREVEIYVTDPVRRVLYVESRPRWEFTFLNRMLSSYRHVEHTSVVYLGPNMTKPLIQGTNLAEAQQIATMTPGQLRRLEAVIIGDVPSTFFSKAQLEAIASIVENGGSVLLPAGRRSFADEHVAAAPGKGAYIDRGFATTPLARALPVELLRRGSYGEGKFRVELTSRGRAHEAFQDVPHAWSRAPHLISLVRIGRLKPGATVLMHTLGTRLPVVVVHRYGRGKAAVVLTDSIWRWKLGMATSPIRVDLQTIFWRQLIEWLMPEQKTEKKKRHGVRVIPDKPAYELNEKVYLTVTALDPDGKPARDARVFCRMEAPDGKLFEQKAEYGEVPGAGQSGVKAFWTSFEPHISGTYKIVATARAQGVDLGRDSVGFVVRGEPIELTEADPDPALLETLARRTGGKHYAAGKAAAIADDIRIQPKTNTWTKGEQVWDRWWVFVTLVGLMSAEWILRKMKQME